MLRSFALTGLPFCFAPSLRSTRRVGEYIYPHRMRRGLGLVVIVPVPPLIRRFLGVTLRRILPLLLTSQRSHVEIAPDRPHRLVGAIVDEVSPEHSVAVAK